MAADAETTKYYTDIMVSNGIKDEVTEVEVRVPAMAGEHFASGIKFVCVKFLSRPEIHLFVKTLIPGTSSETKESAYYADGLEKDGAFLYQFVKLMKDKCTEKLGENVLPVENFFPKVYFADSRAIVMENVTKRGYNVHPRTGQDIEHAKTVLEALATYNAVSHVVIQENGGKASFLKKYPVFTCSWVTAPQIEAIANGTFYTSAEKTLELLARSSRPESLAVLKKLEKYRGKFFAVHKEIYSAPSVVDVMCNGDFWNNNIMFCSSDSELKVVFIDYAMNRVASACNDLSYYIFTTMSAEARKQGVQLLHIYFQKLEETIKRLGFPFTVTFDDFAAEFSRNAIVGLCWGMVVNMEEKAMASFDAEAAGEFSAEAFGAQVSAWASDPKNKEDFEVIVDKCISLVKDFELVAKL